MIIYDRSLRQFLLNNNIFYKEISMILKDIFRLQISTDGLDKTINPVIRSYENTLHGTAFIVHNSEFDLYSGSLLFSKSNSDEIRKMIKLKVFI